MSPADAVTEVERGLSLLYGITLADTRLTPEIIAEAILAGESLLDVVTRVGEESELDDFRDAWVASPEARTKALEWAARWRTPLPAPSANRRPGR